MNDIDSKYQMGHPDRLNAEHRPVQCTVSHELVSRYIQNIAITITPSISSAVPAFAMNRHRANDDVAGRTKGLVLRLP